MLLVGWDGADWRTARPLLDRGALPNLARLVDNGVTAELETIRPTLSPILWTSIATGVAPEKHGVLGFWRPGLATLEEAGESGLVRQLDAVGYLDRDRTGMRLYESSDRRAPAIWNIASEAGLNVQVVAWWASYPAEPVAGRVVSDRFFYSRFDEDAKRRGASYERSGALVFPEALLPRLDAAVLTPRQVTEETLSRFVGGAAPFRDFELDDPLGELRVVVARDASVAAVAEIGLDDEVPDLTMIHFQGIDIASHYFYRDRFPEDWNWTFPAEPVPPAEIERFGGAIDAYYAYLDETLGELLRHADTETAVVLCSDHGFTLGKRDDASSVSGIHYNAAPPGLLVLWGAGVRHGATLSHAHIYDVAPTVLALLGLDLDDGDGRPLTEALVQP